MLRSVVGETPYHGLKTLAVESRRCSLTGIISSLIALWYGEYEHWTTCYLTYIVLPVHPPQYKTHFNHERKISVPVSRIATDGVNTISAAGCNFGAAVG